jgi:tetratricopeptide (TPR) repeat protein
MVLVLDAAADHSDTNGDFGAAIDYLVRASEIVDRMGDAKLVVHIQKHLATAFERVADWDASIRCYERALKSVDPGDEEGYNVTLAHLAGMYLDSLGDAVRAEPLYRRLLAFWAARPNSDGDVALMKRCLGTCLMLRKDWIGAETLLREAIPTFDRLGNTVLQGDAWKYLAACLKAQGRAEEAERATADWHRLIPPGLAV